MNPKSLPTKFIATEKIRQLADRYNNKGGTVFLQTAMNKIIPNSSFEVLSQEDEARYEWRAVEIAFKSATASPIYNNQQQISSEQLSLAGNLSWGNGSCQGSWEDIHEPIGLKNIKNLVKEQPQSWKLEGSIIYDDNEKHITLTSSDDYGKICSKIKEYLSGFSFK